MNVGRSRIVLRELEQFNGELLKLNKGLYYDLPAPFLFHLYQKSFLIISGKEIWKNKFSIGCCTYNTVIGNKKLLSRTPNSHPCLHFLQYIVRAMDVCIHSPVRAVIVLISACWLELIKPQHRRCFWKLSAIVSGGGSWARTWWRVKISENGKYSL